MQDFSSLGHMVPFSLVSLSALVFGKLRSVLNEDGVRTILVGAFPSLKAGCTARTVIAIGT